MTTVFVGTKLGVWMLKPLKLKRPVLFGMIAGIFVLQVLTAIPFIGGVAGFCIFYIGTGAVLRMLYHNYRDSKASLKADFKDRGGKKNDKKEEKKTKKK